MNKPYYLTQEQYDVILNAVDELNPSWKFIREDRSLEVTMNLWSKWINAVANLNREIPSNNRYLMRCLTQDEDLMRQVDDYMILVKI